MKNLLTEILLVGILGMIGGIPGGVFMAADPKTDPCSRAWADGSITRSNISHSPATNTTFAETAGTPGAAGPTNFFTSTSTHLGRLRLDPIAT